MMSRVGSRDGAALRHLMRTVAASLLLLAMARQASAGNCGDRVEGRRVACSCGDNVVADTVLQPTDPVVTEPCAGDGLMLLAPVDAAGLTLNLGGQSIVGRGYGAGIRVVRGGRLGAVIVGGNEGGSRAEIARFGTGIRASGRDALREVRSIDVHDNTLDGLRIHASGAELNDVRSEGNGRDGVALSGHGNQLSRVSAGRNARDGLQVHGSAATMTAEASRNGRNGAVIGGRGNRVDQLRAMDNGEIGVLATGTGHDLRGTTATGNAAGDVAGRERATE